jgi:hypothetical protein
VCEEEETEETPGAEFELTTHEKNQMRGTHTKQGVGKIHRNERTHAHTHALEQSRASTL